MESTTNQKDTTKARVIQNLDLSRAIIGLNELGNLDIPDFEVNLSISETMAELSRIEKVYIRTLNSLMKKHISVDEKGNFMVDNTNQYIFKSADDKKTYLAEYEKLTQHENRIDFSLYASTLKNISGLKASTMSKIHEFLVNDLKK